MYVVSSLFHYSGCLACWSASAFAFAEPSGQSLTPRSPDIVNSIVIVFETFYLILYFWNCIKLSNKIFTAGSAKKEMAKTATEMLLIWHYLENIEIGFVQHLYPKSTALRNTKSWKYFCESGKKNMEVTLYETIWWKIKNLKSMKQQSCPSKCEEPCPHIRLLSPWSENNLRNILSGEREGRKCNLHQQTSQK